LDFDTRRQGNGVFSLMKIYLPNSAHLGNIDHFLALVDPQHPEVLSLALHQKWISVHPFTLAFTACMGAFCKANGGTVIIPEIPKHRSMNYLVRMGLFEVLGVNTGTSITGHEASGRFIPLTRLISAADLKAAITNLVPLLHAPPHVADPIRYVFSELGRNVLEHATSSVGAYVCAQYYQSSNRIAIGIADAGVGVRATIASHHVANSDSAAIRLALQPGVTGTTSRIGGTEFNAGAGLFFTKSIAALSRNFFVIYSGNSAFKLLRTPAAEEVLLNTDPAKDHHRELIVPAWRGTAIGIDMSVEETVEFSSLLDDIRQAYSMDVKAKSKAYYKKIQFRK
jgi:anti-sigma regulatory factor (Ser/Thr protein kinase)